MKAAPIAMASTKKRYRIRPGERTETITLAWDASAGATGYRLYYSPTPGDWVNYYDVGNVTTYQVSRPAGDWFYAVTAVNANGESAKSNTVGGGF